MLQKQPVKLSLSVIPENAEVSRDANSPNTPTSPIPVSPIRTRFLRRNSTTRPPGPRTHRPTPSRLGITVENTEDEHAPASPTRKDGTKIPVHLRLAPWRYATQKPYEVRQGTPKTLPEMLQVSGGGNTRCNRSGQLAFLTALARDDSPSSTVTILRTCRDSLPLNYVPFEPLFPGSRESKIKIFTAPSLKDDDSTAFTLGMRLQVPRPIEELGLNARLLGTHRRVSTRRTPIAVTKRYG